MMKQNPMNGATNTGTRISAIVIGATALSGVRILRIFLLPEPGLLMAKGYQGGSADKGRAWATKVLV